RALAQSTIETPDGRTVQLGNYGPVIEMVLTLAKQGQQVDMDNITRAVGNRATASNLGAGSDIRSQLNDLTAKIHSAQMRGNKAEAKALDRQRQSLANRAYGGKPIVGQGGRYV